MPPEWGIKTLKSATTCSYVSGHWSHFHEDYELFLLCKALLGKCWPNLHLNKSSISCLCQRFKRVPCWNYGPTSGPCAQIVVFAEELIIQAKMTADHNQAHGGNLIWQKSPWRRHFSFQLWIGSSSWLIERKVSWSKQSTRFWLKFSSLKQSLRSGEQIIGSKRLLFVSSNSGNPWLSDNDIQYLKAITRL